MAAALRALDLHRTVGALELGCIFSTFLFGIVTLQSYVYYQNFRDDNWKYKTMVAVLWVVELAHSICVIAEVYRVTVTLYCQPQELITFDFLGVATALGGTITLIAHTFFALRLYKILPRRSIWLSYNAITWPDISTYRIQWGWLILTLLSTGCAIDVVIAASMLYYLISKREGRFNRATRLIDSLVHFTIRTGLLTSLGAIIMVIAFVMLKETLIWLALYTCLAKLYSNSLLSALNERTTLRSAVAQSTSLEPSNGFRNRSGHLRRVTCGGNDQTTNADHMFISVEMKSSTHVSPGEDRKYQDTKIKPFAFSELASSGKLDNDSDDTMTPSTLRAHLP
ncbi:hypothetical protein FA15DRAFT_761362 [Coprinopsis marcescibilis]|uniref:DUF6534 domain-containing protein n=1 Tax=Coprinopsis marcescibilis TaxID=230819 RepID=A0A5C3K9V1_COPMA|nr:hypothetical protein FA15DRAFT_761362 [Coprinopsis marcescibilis]